MFHHVKELQFNARVSKPDPGFARMLLEQFGGGNGELKAAMQYFTQAFTCRRPYPDKYDLLMDIATEEFSHLEIVGATITMLLDGINGELKDAAHLADVTKLMEKKSAKEEMMAAAMMNPQFLCLTGGGPSVSDANGYPWNGNYVNANGDLTVDLRSDIAAESRAKIVYEYLLQFTDDALVQDTLRFLMTREVAHFQMFSAALETIQPNFPPGVLQGDPRYTHTYFNMSNGPSAKGPWNEGQGPWPKGDKWEYIDSPAERIVKTRGETTAQPNGSGMTLEECEKLDKKMSKTRSGEIMSKSPKSGELQWCEYPQKQVEAP